MPGNGIHQSVQEEAQSTYDLGGGAY